MRLNSVVLGVTVVAVLASGVYWARQRTSAHHLATWSPAGTDGAGGAARANADPDVTVSPASVADGPIQFRLSITPNPPVAYRTIKVRVRTESHGTSILLGEGRVRFDMDMPMGNLQYTLVPSADGWQEADVVLPTCPTGSPRWYATVEGMVEGERRAARFRFDLSTSPARPAT